MNMEYRQLGYSGLKVPVLAFGTATFGGGNDFFRAWGNTQVEEASRLVTIALEAGVNLFDTADAYSGGLSEEVLGGAIANRRDQVLIATKAAFRMEPGPNGLGTSRHRLIRACEASLRRLRTDYIDLYQLHCFDAVTPVEEDSARARRSRSRRQGPIHRLLEFLRLAPDEVTRLLGKIWPAALRRPSGLLFADRP